MDNILYFYCSNESYLAVPPCAQFIKHHEEFLKSVDQTLAFDHSNESHGEALRYFKVFYVFQFIIFFKVVFTTNL